MYDLESMTEPQRQDYLKSLCLKLGIPDNLGLISLVYIDSGDGPSHLVPYIKRGGSEAIRNNLGVTVTSLTNQMVGGSIVFTATGVDKNNRQEVAIGSKYIDGLTGTELDDAVMTSSTRALRRLALQFTGTGLLDESEVNQRKTVHTTAAPIAPAPQPTVQPSSAPGKYITEDIIEEQKAMQDAVNAKIDDLIIMTGTGFESREQVVARLNAEAATEPKVKKTRKRRAKVDMGPSEVPATTVASVAEPVTLPPPSVPAQQAVDTPTSPVSVVAEPPAPKKPRLSAEQSKPFRQRYFSIISELELAGFAPRENMSNTAKMRSLAQIVFPELIDLNELTEPQWVRYLTLLEQKIEKEGPAATVKFIEDTIGI